MDAQNFFSEKDQYFLELRIGNLSKISTRWWGKMTIEQMLAHCSIQLKMALGHLPEGKMESSFLYRTMIGRWLSLYFIRWPRGFETPAEMDVVKNNLNIGDFEIERQKLLYLLQELKVLDLTGTHPFYGQINKKDWGRLIWLHLDHHLRQFGN